MTVAFYTSRVILQSLGVDDFGVYTGVGGIALMFNLLFGPMTDASQRFITFELGKGVESNTGQVFSTSMILHLIIALFFVIAVEPFGLWFLNNKLIIPADRIMAASWVFQFSIMTVLIQVISIPFNALVIAHERMGVFAYISIFEACLKLLIAFIIAADMHSDRLILYAMLMMISQACVFIIYLIYCRSKFAESRARFTWDGPLVSQMLKFAAWTVFGNTSFTFCNQGISLLLGSFFPPFVNAARGIAIQLQNPLNTFASNFQKAVNPQITKSYAIGDKSDVNRLLLLSSRFSFFLMLFPLVPIAFETEELLHLWLGMVPDYSVLFVRYVVLITLITILINPLEVAVKASGDIKRFELLIYGTKTLILPVAYLQLRFGMAPDSVFLTLLIFEALALLLAVYETSRLTGLSLGGYSRQVLFICCLTMALSCLIPALIFYCMPHGLVRMFVLFLISIFSTLIVICSVGLSSVERGYLKSFIISKLRRL